MRHSRSPENGNPLIAASHTDRVLCGVYYAIVLLMVWHFGLGERPLWFDELLQFAIGAQESTLAALLLIHDTTDGINHGQTGVYLLLDYWLLEVFGANITALRLPSILAFAFLLHASRVLLKSQNVGWIGQFLCLAAIAGQFDLMRLVANARPFLPLAAASVGVFAYYALAVEDRKRLPNRLLGYAAILGGAAIHPFFSIYWAAAFWFWYLVAAYRDQLRIGIASAMNFVNFRLSLAGFILFFAIAFATWLPRHPSLGRNPFQYNSAASLPYEFLAGSHFQFVWLAGFAVAAYVAMILVLWANPKLRPASVVSETLFPLHAVVPAALVMTALSLSFLLAVICYASGYWIVDWQWTGSTALVPVATIWLFAELSRALSVHSRSAAMAVSCLAVCVLLIGSLFSVQRFNAIADLPIGPDYSQRTNQLAAIDPAAMPVPTNCLAHLETSDWIPTANANLQLGGPVWPMFKDYYAKCAW
ncbi:MAG: hypothetical protein AAGA00_03260 [Pseudomonadota bacterium]